MTLSIKTPSLKCAVISIFPEMFHALTGYGVIGRAAERGILDLQCFNPRDYTKDAYRRVDQRPYGGGPGMVMMAEPLYQAIQAAKAALGKETPVFFLSPQGPCFTQKKAAEWATLPAMILLCGRYEGVDQRLIDICVDAEISIGEYIVSGGELPAMVIVDAVTRLLPGVLGHPLSAVEESFSEGDRLDYPVFTEPHTWQGHEVPEVLRSGHHEKIKAWRDAKCPASKSS
jgi:tRNA (guanine37-N1)-methyltransferase